MTEEMRLRCACRVDQERRWIFTRGSALLTGALALPAMPVYSAGPLLWFWRLVSGRTLAREQMKFLGGVAGQALRTAVAPASVRTGMSLAGGIGVASSATIVALGAHQLAESYSPEWVARLKARIADFTISRGAGPEGRRVGFLHEEAWAEPANLMHGVRYHPADDEQAPPMTVSHQRWVLAGEKPGPSVVELTTPSPGVYAAEMFIWDLDRQRLYLSTGGLPPPIVKFD
jgi:hypothetical protein